MRKITYLLLLHLSVQMFTTQTKAQVNCVAPAQSCSGSDVSNSFLNSINPNTIEYDNIVSTFHATLVRKADGNYFVWGENMGFDGNQEIFEPSKLDSFNYPGMKGNVLKFAAGSWGIARSQNIVLTTEGLYSWTSEEGTVLDPNLTTGLSFQKLTIGGMANGLPMGVNPADVKMLFASTRIMAIVTCNGDAYTLVNSENRTGVGYGYGDGISYSTANDMVWHRVKKSASATDYLTNIVALRGNNNTFIALDATGNLFTWGENALTGSGSAFSQIIYATPMQALPIGVKPKMIGMNGFYNSTFSNNFISYYVLGDDGKVYSMGDNSKKQLGDLTTTNRTSWVNVLVPATNQPLSNIVWISPNEHDATFGSGVNALQTNGNHWAWGSNTYDMLGIFNVATLDPRTALGGNAATDKMLAVETGGHATVLIKACTNKFSYVGHNINGSMGNGTNFSDDNGGLTPNYNFGATGNGTNIIDLCAAPAKVQIINPSENGAVCGPTTLNSNIGGGTFNYVSGNATVVGNTLTPTGPGDISFSYTATVNGCPQETITQTVKQYDFGNLNPSIYPISSASTAASNRTWLGVNAPSIECVTKVVDETDGLKIKLGTNPVTGNGSETNKWILNGNTTYNFEVTVNGNGTNKPVYYGLFFDVNGDGDFNDFQDLVSSGNATHNASGNTVTFQLTVPVNGTAAGATQGAIRLVSTSTPLGFNQTDNGNVFLTNGEIEDFYVMYSSPLTVKLGDFTATKQANQVLLKWNTITETNNKGFYIERSTNQNNWETLGFVPSAATNGQSASALNYQFSDEKLAGLNNQVYYRIKQVDFDAKFEYTAIRIVNLKGNAAISYYPNPVTDNLNVAGLDGNETILIINEQGQILKSAKATNKNININLQQLSAGVYFMKVISSNQNSSNTYKIMKVK
jgi:alpha-tubulin suppressor-like RCC1 family protein